jgi:hypothetical protein
MKTRDYDTDYNKNTGNTDTHVATDTQMENTIRDGSTLGDREAFEEGFAAASGIRPETAESGGRIRHPESKDAARHDPVAKLVKNENSGLAD